MIDINCVVKNKALNLISSLDFWYSWNRSKQYAAQLRRMPPSVSAHSRPSARIAEVNIHSTTMIPNEAVGICVSKLGYGFEFQYLNSETLITLTDSSSFWRGLMESRFAPWVQLVVHTTPCHGLLAHWPQYRLGIWPPWKSSCKDHKPYPQIRFSDFSLISLAGGMSWANPAKNSITMLTLWSDSTCKHYLWARVATTDLRTRLSEMQLKQKSHLGPVHDDELKLRNLHRAHGSERGPKPGLEG